MPLIIESIVVTRSASGEDHIAPLGIIAEGENWIVAPFKPSRTLDNLRANPVATASMPRDVRVFAGCLTGRKDWPLVGAGNLACARLADAISHRELEVMDVIEDVQRPRFVCRTVYEKSHCPAPGFNRAQAAVIECAILVSRLHMLPEEKVRTELAYLDIAVSKTAGAAEQEAWSWLVEKIEGHYAAAKSRV
jgi:uncharacterized protein